MLKPARRLSLLDVTALGLNAIVGSGIFLFPGTLAGLAGPASILIFAVTGILLATIALCYGELGGMYADNGGSYLYAREAFGDALGFGVGWLAWAVTLLSWAAIASLAATQAAYFIPAISTPWLGRVVAAGVLVGFGALNYRGIRPAASTLDVLAVIKIAPLLLFALLCLPKVQLARFTPFFSGEGHFGYGVFLALWALGGFEGASVPAGEAANPQRAVPKAILGSLAAATILYVLVQTAAVGVFSDLARSDRPLVDAARSALGPWGAAMLAGGGTLSMLGFLAGAALAEPRYLAALGERNLRRWRLNAVHPRTGVPHRAIVATTAGAAILVLLLPTLRLVDLVNVVVVSQYLSTCAAALVLRRTKPQLPRPYRVPAIWLVAPAGIAITLWLLTQVSRFELLASAAVLAAGFAVRALIDRK